MHIAADPRTRRGADGGVARACGLNRFPLELVDCPDRRIARAVLEVVAEEVGRRAHRGHACSCPAASTSEFWHRFLHDRTSDSIAKALGGAARTPT